MNNINEFFIGCAVWVLIGWCTRGGAYVLMKRRRERDERMRKKGQREVLKEFYKIARENENRVVFYENEEVSSGFRGRGV